MSSQATWTFSNPSFWGGVMRIDATVTLGEFFTFWDFSLDGKKSPLFCNSLSFEIYMPSMLFPVFAQNDWILRSVHTHASKGVFGASKLKGDPALIQSQYMRWILLYCFGKFVYRQVEFRIDSKHTQCFRGPWFLWSLPKYVTGCTITGPVLIIATALKMRCFDNFPLEIHNTKIIIGVFCMAHIVCKK